MASLSFQLLHLLFSGLTLYPPPTPFPVTHLPSTSLATVWRCWTPRAPPSPSESVVPPTTWGCGRWKWGRIMPLSSADDLWPCWMLFCFVLWTGACAKSLARFCHALTAMHLCCSAFCCGVTCFRDRIRVVSTWKKTADWDMRHVSLSFCACDEFHPRTAAHRTLTIGCDVSRCAPCPACASVWESEGVSFLLQIASLDAGQIGYPCLKAQTRLTWHHHLLSRVWQDILGHNFFHYVYFTCCLPLCLCLSCILLQHSISNQTCDGENWKLCVQDSC